MPSQPFPTYPPLTSCMAFVWAPSRRLLIPHYPHGVAWIHVTPHSPPPIPVRVLPSIVPPQCFVWCRSARGNMNHLLMAWLGPYQVHDTLHEAAASFATRPKEVHRPRELSTIPMMCIGDVAIPLGKKRSIVCSHEGQPYPFLCSIREGERHCLMSASQPFSDGERG